MQELKDTLAHYRHVRGMTQHELSDAANRSRSSIANAEIGKCPSPGIREMNDIANALGITLDQLAKGPGEIAMKLVSHRRTIGRTLENVATAVGISPWVLTQIELGEREPSRITMRKILKLEKEPKTDTDPS